MATARVIHFGSDDCHRVLTLRKVGFEVCVSDSLERLRLDLEGNEGVDAVLVAEGTRRTTERAAAMVQRYSCAPLVLFHRSHAPLCVKRFDQVYTPSVPAVFWLLQTAVLVEQTQDLQKTTKHLISKSKSLLGEVQAARREMRRQLERAAFEKKRNRGQAKPWHESDEHI
jgi:hypothetical protein